MATAKTKLNKNARAWVKALRSGKYKQVQNSLTSVDQKTGEILGHCCLGVLCELAVKAKVIPPPRAGSDNLYYDGENAILTDAVRDWAGLKTSTGRFNGGDSALTVSNDEGKSFKQIARIIEQKAKELFV